MSQQAIYDPETLEAMRQNVARWEAAHPSLAARPVPAIAGQVKCRTCGALLRGTHRQYCFACRVEGQDFRN